MPRPPKVLFITRHTPLPWEDGSGAYVFDLLRFLRKQGFVVHVAWLEPHAHLRWQGIWALPSDYARTIRLHVPGAIRWGRRLIFPGIYWFPFKAKLLNSVKRLLTALGLFRRRTAAPDAPRTPSVPTSPRSWMDTPNAAETAFAAAMANKLRPDIIIANYPWLTPIIPPDFAGHRACLHHDIAWKRSLHQASFSGQPPEVTAELEAGWLKSVDTVIDISAEDAAETSRLCPAARHVLARKAVSPHPLPQAPSRRLLFVGSGNNFNAEGLSWFLQNVWPGIRRGQPDASLDVCGSIDRVVQERPEGVVFHGQVPDIVPFYAGAAVVIVPLLHATGLNIKLVDAAAFSRAIITTSVTIQGAPFLQGAVCLADSPVDFAGKTVRLLSSEADRTHLARQALEVVSAQLAPAVTYADLAHALRPASSSV